MKLLIVVNTITSISLATANNENPPFMKTSVGTMYGSSCDPKIESESCTCDMVTSIPDLDFQQPGGAFPFYSCTKGKCFKVNDGTGTEGCLQIPNGSFTCNDCAASEGDDNMSVSAPSTSVTDTSYSVTDDDTSSTSVTGTSSETKTSTSSEPKTASEPTPKSKLSMESSASIHTYPVISVLAMLIISPLNF